MTRKKHLQERIEYAGCEDKFGANFTVLNLYGVCQAIRFYVVCSIDEDDMHECHSCKERNNARCHDLIFPKEPLIPDIAPTKPEADNDEGEDGAPPAVEERGVIGETAAALRRRFIVEGPW